MKATIKCIEESSLKVGDSSTEITFTILVTQSDTFEMRKHQKTIVLTDEFVSKVHPGIVEDRKIHNALDVFGMFYQENFIDK